MKQTYITGLNGEDTAEKYLHETRNMKCLEHRYRNKCGEIDLIMQDGEYLVFVEVKTRKTGAPGTGMMAVNSSKQKRITQAALLYLMISRQTDRPIRFDVVEVNAESVIHIPNAFQPGKRFYR